MDKKVVKEEWRCRPKCSECCGPISFDAEFYDDHAGSVQRIPKKIVPGPNGTVYPFCDDNRCAFLHRGTNRCSIYEDRPDVCMEYGTIPELPCPYINTNGRPRSPAKVRRMQRKINHDIDAKMKKLEQITKSKGDAVCR